jgi:GxxExxY protein
LDDEVECVVRRVIGSCLAVHRALGPGLLEAIYVRAVCIELAACGLPFEREKEIPVSYREQLIYVQRLDIVAANRVLIEVKSVERLQPVHQAQVVSYLRASGLRVGLLVNFNVPILKQGLKRIIL